MTDKTTLLKEQDTKLVWAKLVWIDYYTRYLQSDKRVNEQSKLIAKAIQKIIQCKSLEEIIDTVVSKVDNI